MHALKKKGVTVISIYSIIFNNFRFFKNFLERIYKQKMNLLYLVQLSAFIVTLIDGVYLTHDIDGTEYGGKYLL